MCLKTQVSSVYKRSGTENGPFRGTLRHRKDGCLNFLIVVLQARRVAPSSFPGCAESPLVFTMFGGQDPGNFLLLLGPFLVWAALVMGSSSIVWLTQTT